MTIGILAFSGSLRADSINNKLLNIATAYLGSKGVKVKEVSLRDLDLPLYNQDLEQNGLPESAMKFKQLLLESDAILIASPEHNSTYTAALKNAIDWASRRSGDEPALASFENKIAAIISASPGALGGLRGLSQLRTLLENIRVMVIPDQLAVNVGADTFANDKLNNPSEQKRLEVVLNRLINVTSKIKEEK